jgi:hypothetical protein
MNDLWILESDATYLTPAMAVAEAKRHAELEEKAKRVVAGSQACRGPKDAALILQALGLIPYRQEES